MENLDPKKVLADLTKNANKYCGAVNPICLDDYVAFGGYEASSKVVNNEVDVISILKDANLVARKKLNELCADRWIGAETVVCETEDPMATFDLKVQTEAPHVIVEAMIIFMHVNNAKKGVIVVNDELAYNRLDKAVTDAKNAGLNDKDIIVSKVSIDGLKENAQLLANVVAIVQNSYKPATAKGLKGVAIGGKVKNPGIYEIEDGTTYRKLIEEIAGGATGKVKAIKVGAPYGEYLSSDILDEKINFMSLMMNGMVRGTALIVVLDESTDMAKEISDYLGFLLNVSCGKCFPCKVGTKRMDEMVKEVVKGNATKENYNMIKSIAVNMNIGTLCPIGQKGAVPVLTALENFRDDFIKE